MARRPLEIVTPGVVGYETALLAQERSLESVIAGGPDTLYLLEHQPVYTLGRGADEAFLGAARGGRVPIVRTSRGGEVTYHGPGQLVGYPIVNLRDWKMDVRAYVCRIEQCLLDVLASWRITGRREPGAPGVWVGDRKIASVGIAIRKWVAWHGFALNVGTDVSAFEAITPCGITGLRMTSVALEGGPQDVASVLPVVRDRFAAAFDYDAISAPSEPAAEAAP